MEAPLGVDTRASAARNRTRAVIEHLFGVGGGLELLPRSYELAVDRSVVHVLGHRDDVVVVHGRLAALIATHHQQPGRTV